MGLLAVGVAALSHLASDPVTHAPRILLWPLLGADFAQVTLLGTWATIVTETAAGLIMVLVARSLHHRDRLHLLWQAGRL
jgi:hypothetical protein